MAACLSCPTIRRIIRGLARNGPCFEHLRSAAFWELPHHVLAANLHFRRVRHQILNEVLWKKRGLVSGTSAPSFSLTFWQPHLPSRMPQRVRMKGNDVREYGGRHRRGLWKTSEKSCQGDPGPHLMVPPDTGSPMENSILATGRIWALVRGLSKRIFWLDWRSATRSTDTGCMAISA